MKHFLAAWERVDVPALMELLADDAVLTMPPEPMRVVGPEAIGSFFATVPMDGRLDRIRLLPTRANGQPALAAYVDAADGTFQAYGVMVFSLDGDRIVGIVGFADYGPLVPAFDLPEVLR
jgi:RNA polymerase sigma-70 factor (ECF subfamily)